MRYTCTNIYTLSLCAAVPLSLNALTLLKWRDASECEQRLSLVDEVSFGWITFGLRVGLKMDRLKAWEKQYHEDTTRCWLEVMEHWLNKEGTDDYPAMWEGLHTLLKDAGHPKVAHTLEAAFQCHKHNC